MRSHDLIRLLDEPGPEHWARPLQISFLDLPQRHERRRAGSGKSRSAAALDQGQPLGDARFIDSIERATGQRREIRPRGRPRKAVLEETGPRDQISLDV